MQKKEFSFQKISLKVLFFLSFYLKWADPYLIAGFQRKNESCQKCCQFRFYELWQRTFHFLHILWDLKIELGISPPSVNIIIPTGTERILFSFQRAFSHVMQLCESCQPCSVCSQSVSIPVLQMRKLRHGGWRGFPRTHSCYEQSWDLEPSLTHTLIVLLTTSGWVFGEILKK